MNNKNLIMAYATNIGLPDLSRFLISARDALPPRDVDIVLFVNNKLDNDYIQLAHQLQVSFIPVVSLWKDTAKNPALKIPYRLLLLCFQILAKVYPRKYKHAFRVAAMIWLHPILARHFTFKDYLMVNSEYNCVLLCDCRDIVFQASPFEFAKSNKLNCFEQDSSLKYGGANIDDEWMKSVYGESIYALMYGKQTLCCGTIMGGSEVLLKYLSAMEDEILERVYGAIDQAILNKMVYLDFDPDFVEVNRNDLGIVLTLGGVNKDSYEVIDKLVFQNGYPVAIVHQYDRSEKLKSMLEEKYNVSHKFWCQN